ncbi:hypothetical protein F4677DRAFT_419799, partial [Hypoxylon crocopeplum]
MYLHMLGFFLKEISAIVRATCRMRGGDHPSRGSCPLHPSRGPRQKLLCSGASISDSAEENPSHVDNLPLSFRSPGCPGRDEAIPEAWERALVGEEKVHTCVHKQSCVHGETWGWAGRVSLQTGFAGSPVLSQRPPARLETKPLSGLSKNKKQNPKPFVVRLAVLVFFWNWAGFFTILNQPTNQHPLSKRKKKIEKKI